MQVSKLAKVTMDLDESDVQAIIEEADIVSMLYLMRRLVNNIRTHEKLAALKYHWPEALREFVDDMSKFVEESRAA